MAKQRSAQDIFMEILGQNFLDSPDYTTLSAPKPRGTELAQYLMSHSKPGPTIKTDSSRWSREGASTEEPGVLNKIFDFLDVGTGSRTARNIVDAVTSQEDDSFVGNVVDEVGDIGKAIAGGVIDFAGQTVLKPATWAPFGLGDKLEGTIDELSDKWNPDIRGSKIMENLGVENKYGKGIGGFAAELALDPSLAIPGIGFAKSAARKAADAQKVLDQKAAVAKPELFQQEQAVAPKLELPKPATAIQGGAVPPKNVIPTPGPVAPPMRDITTPLEEYKVTQSILNDPDLLEAMKKEKRSDQGWRAAQKRWGRDPDVEEAARANPLSKAEWSDKMKQAKLAKAGKVTDGKGDISAVSVQRVMDDIQSGNIPSFGPKPAYATGAARNLARKEADDHINSVMGKTRTDHNPANQANLYNRMFAATAKLFESDPDLVAKYGGNLNSKRALKARGVMARAMLRSAEDHMITLGAHPVYWDGTRLRLSDVLEEIGPKATGELPTKVIDAFKTGSMNKIKDPVVKEAITRALARRPLHMAHLLEDLDQKALAATKNILDNYSYPKARAVASKLEDVIEKQARDMGMTDAEVKAAIDHVRNTVRVDGLEDLPHEKFVLTLAARMREAKEAGRMDADTYLKMQAAVSKILGQTKKDLMSNITGNKVVDGVMLRLSTWHGRLPDMKKFSQDVFTWGEMSAVMRGRWLRNMAQGASRDELIKGFMIAQGRLPATEAFSPKEQELAAKFADYMQTMIDSSGFKDLKDFGGTVAERSQMVMSDINRWLTNGGSKFQFIDGKAENFLGVKKDYSAKGEGWMKSWELADPKKSGQDPISFMYDLDLAIERTVKEYALIDEFARTYGVHKSSPHFQPSVHTAQFVSNRLPKGLFFEPSQRDMFQRLMNDLQDGMWHPSNKIIQHYSRGIRAWKTGVTIYMPSHHIRNMIGDLHLMWWAGHNDPRNFLKARNIMQTQRGKYAAALKSDNLSDLRALTDQDAMELARVQGTDIVIKQNGVQLSAEEVYVAAFQHGLLLDANKYEDIFGQAPLENLTKNADINKRLARPLGGKGHHAASQIAEYREHYVRIAHFVGALNKGLKKSNNLDEVMKKAADEVRKWHPDGRDLTNFEHKVRLFGIPFYSWTRKALPLIVQSMATRPSKMLYYPRAQMAMQEMMGVGEDPTHLDPFPDNQLFPDWIRARGIGPVADAESENAVSAFLGKMGRNGIGFHGQEQGQTIINPSNPMQDVVDQIMGLGGSPLEIAKSIFDSSGPQIKMPVEIATDSTFSGAPIDADKPGGVGIVNYLLSQVPIASAANNVLELDARTGFKPKESKGGTEPGRDWQAFINYLTAAGIRGTGGSTQLTAEFEAADRARAEKQ